MKIVFIGGRDIHILGGIENYTLNLATQLVRQGNRVIVYCESDRNGSEVVNGFEVRYVRGPKSNLLCKPWVSLKATLRTVFRDRDTDCIHYNAWGPSLWCWIASLGGIPSLMEGHGLEWQRSKYSPFAQKIMKMMEGLTARMNRNLVMCSEDQVRYFLKTYGKQSVCIPGAINLPDASAGNSSDILWRFGIPEGRYFLYLGRLVQDKNPDYLIRAFKSASLPGWKLVVAGDNPAMPEYVEKLHSLAESEDIIFTGAVYGEDKYALLRNAFAFCIPSTIEGLSIVLMEAMSFRLPVVASDIPANRELLAENAIYAAPENDAELAGALKEAASLDENKVAEMTGKNFEKISSEYVWENVSRKYAAYLETVVKQGKKNG